jgi:hypothetical protein
VTESIDFQGTDAWLLLSIIAGGGTDGATLYDIISTCDGLNHAVFVESELESGFARLSAGGLIEERERRFRPTERATVLYRKAEPAGNSHEALDALRRLLGADRLPGDQPHPNPKNTLSYPGFSSEAVREAVEQWYAEGRRILENLRK